MYSSVLLLCVSHLSERTQAGVPRAIKTLAENRAEKGNYRRKTLFFKPCLFTYFFIANDTRGGNKNTESTVTKHNRPVFNGIEQLCNTVMGMRMLLYLSRKKRLTVHKRPLIYWGILEAKLG